LDRLLFLLLIIGPVLLFIYFDWLLLALLQLLLWIIIVINNLIVRCFKEQHIILDVLIQCVVLLHAARLIGRVGFERGPTRGRPVATVAPARVIPRLAAIHHYAAGTRH
jgi:hypothetical protein